MGKEYYNNSKLTVTRKKLRNFATIHEQLLWNELKGSKFLGLKFRRQQSVGRYILDFYCPSIKIGIEVDGDNHFEDEIIEYDRIRSEYIEADDIKIYRFTNKEIETKLKIVLEKLKEAINKN